MRKQIILDSRDTRCPVAKTVLDIRNQKYPVRLYPEGVKPWYENGRYHRGDDSPAVEFVKLILP